MFPVKHRALLREASSFLLSSKRADRASTRPSRWCFSAWARMAGAGRTSIGETIRRLASGAAWSSSEQRRPEPHVRRFPRPQVPPSAGSHVRRFPHPQVPTSAGSHVRRFATATHDPAEKMMAEVGRQAIPESTA
jgi:hypothetical protein